MIIDLFAGGGGASLGIEMALGRSPDAAINHNQYAIAMHLANHPETKLYCQNVIHILPRQVTGGRHVDLLWASPDCKHFSKAKGGKPKSQGIRDLAWVVVRWAEDVRPRLIILENVEEFRTWGPLNVDGQPIQERSGDTFRAWVRRLRRNGYKVDYRLLRACDYGAPTIRKRFFLIARCDGLPIIWPDPTHGTNRAPYRIAAECINWSIPCPSIFERVRPLAEATLKRIANGIKKFVLDTEKPFLVNHNDLSLRDQEIDQRTITQNCRQAMVKNFLISFGNSIGSPIETSIPTVIAENKIGLVTSHLIKLRGSCRHGQSVNEPMATITAGGNHLGEVRAFLIKYYGNGVGQRLQEPMATVTSKDHFGLVMIHNESYAIADIG
ncbi:MAG: DNA cytosine methyltransferase, partial [Deltaproteobacteria bacterium]|nr:DNA cytosine methyltransferase [Deltaproteobacteria bacterium]